MSIFVTFENNYHIKYFSFDFEILNLSYSSFSN